MSSIAIPMTAWPEIVSHLEAMGQPWPRAAALADWAFWLEHHRQGKVARLPGRPKLMQRWNWSGYRVAQFLEETARAPLPAPAVAPVASDALVAPRPQQVELPLARQRAQQAPLELKAGTRQATDRTSAAKMGVSGGDVGDEIVDFRRLPADFGQNAVSVAGQCQQERPRTAAEEALHQPPVTGHSSTTSGKRNSFYHGDFAQNAVPPAVQAVGAQHIYSSYSSTSKKSEGGLRSHVVEEVDPKDAQDLDPTLLETFCQLLERWSSPEAPMGRQWMVNLREDVLWFKRELLEMKEAAKIDMLGLLRNWRNHLEAVSNSQDIQQRCLFPRYWRKALARQVELSAAWHERRMQREASRTATEAEVFAYSGRSTQAAQWSARPMSAAARAQDEEARFAEIRAKHIRSMRPPPVGGAHA